MCGLGEKLNELITLQMADLKVGRFHCEYIYHQVCVIRWRGRCSIYNEANFTNRSPVHHEKRTALHCQGKQMSKWFTGFLFLNKEKVPVYPFQSENCATNKEKMECMRHCMSVVKQFRIKKFLVLIIYIVHQKSRYRLCRVNCIRAQHNWNQSLFKK